jgi:hypothetical protein
VSDLAMFMLIRGSLSLCLLAGGLYALKKGFQLYVRKGGQVEESLTLRIGPLGTIKFSPKRVGSLVMITAVAWGYLGFLVMPQRIVANPSDGGFMTCAPDVSFPKK